MPEEDRYAYSEGLRRGGTVVSVRTTDANYDRALEILDAQGAVNIWTNGKQPGALKAGRDIRAATLQTLANWRRVM